MEILHDFPYLTLQDKKGLHYHGFIELKGVLYRLEVKLPGNGTLSQATVNCDANFRRVLSPYSEIIKQRLSQCDSLHGFLKEIQSIAENQLERHAVADTDSPVFCRQLLDHIELLGWDKLEYVSDDFREVHMATTDVALRKHVMKLYIGKQFPRDCPKCSVQLPVKFDLHWSAHATLTKAYGQFEVAVDTFQDFWNQMAEIDVKTWVLEPEKPTHAAKHRRIAINPSVSVQITVDPNNPRVLPDCMFLGSDQAIKPLRQSMNANISAWNEESGILDNLGRLLNVTFPLQQPLPRRSLDWSVASVTHIGWRRKSPRRSAASHAVNRSSTGHAWLIGYVLSHPVDRALIPYLGTVHIVKRQ